MNPRAIAGRLYRRAHVRLDAAYWRLRNAASGGTVEVEVCEHLITLSTPSAGCLKSAILTERNNPLLCLFMETISEGVAFLDIGAHHGIYSVIAAKRGATVTAVEPSPYCVDVLKNNLELNGVRRCTVMQAAAGARTERVRLFVPSTDPSVETASLKADAASRPNGALWAPDETQLEVQQIRLDETGIEPDAIKLDVEGHEAHVIEGLTGILSRASTLLLEIHPDRIEPLTADSLLERLRSIGLEPTDRASKGRQLHVLLRR